MSTERVKVIIRETYTLCGVENGRGEESKKRETMDAYKSRIVVVCRTAL